MMNEKEQMDLGRRKFCLDLGRMTGGLALLSAAPWLKACTDEKVTATQGETARIGMVGTGSRGRYHIHNLLALPHARVTALCDIYPPNLEAAQALCPGARAYTDYRRLLDDPEVDGVVISTPLGLHADMTLAALSAGKHVFCEKAMALTMEQCKEVYDAYQAGDRALYYCMQRMYDPKYIEGVQRIKDGLIGDVVGMRCHWFRNADWRRPVPSPELERLINWRLYQEFSGGLMTELATHQLEVCNWVAGRLPSEAVGMGDIVYWKDGREVYDSVNVTYRFSDGRKIAYESLISNKYNGMEDQILGKGGTVDLTKGVYYLEEDTEISGMRRLMDSIRQGVFAAVPTAGPSWRPEYRNEYVPHPLVQGSVSVNGGQSMVAADHDGSDLVMSAFCISGISGEKAENVVEEAYGSTLLCLLGNQAMAEGRTVRFPEEYKIPYMKF